MKPIATRERAFGSYGFSLMKQLPNPDPILKRIGKDIEAYKEIAADGFVAGNIRRRKAAVKALKRRINPIDNAEVDLLIEKLFDKLPISTLITEILNATLYGYQPLEIIWDYQPPYILPQSVTAKPANWFCFDADNRLRFKSKDAPIDGELLDMDRFLLATQDATYENPYGIGFLSYCYWPTIFKKGGLRYWFEFVDKYGSPILYSKIPRNAQSTEEEQALDSLEMLRSSSVSVFPQDSEVNILESNGKSSSSEVHNTFMNYCRSEIAVAIVGQNQTTEANSTNASAQSGLEVAEDIRDDDKSIVEAVFNELIQKIVDKNFGIGDAPTFELFEQENIDTVQAERDTQLTGQGVKFSKAYYMKTYNLEEEDIVDIDHSSQSSNPFMFSESDKSPSSLVEKAESEHVRLEEATDQLLTAMQDDNPIDDWLKPILQCITENKPTEASQKLAELFPELSLDALTEKVQRMIFVAEVWGRISNG